MRPQKQARKPAFGYLRVSSREQTKKGGFPRQESAIRAFAAQNGYEIVEWFREGIKGETDVMKRPVFSAMFEKLATNGVRTVIVENLDRLARKVLVVEAVVDSFRKLNIELLEACSQEEATDIDPDRVLLRQVKSIIAEYDRQRIVIRLKAGRLRKKALTGRCEGRKPYPFYPGELETFQRMKELRAEGLGFDRIAATLSREGRFNRRGKPFRGFAVNRILKRKSPPCETGRSTREARS